MNYSLHKVHIFHVKIQLFVTAKYEQDPICIGLAPWIRIRIEEKAGSGSEIKPMRIHITILNQNSVLWTLLHIIFIGRSELDVIV